MNTVSKRINKTLNLGDCICGDGTYYKKVGDNLYQKLVDADNSESIKMATTFSPSTMTKPICTLQDIIDKDYDAYFESMMESEQSVSEFGVRNSKSSIEVEKKTPKGNVIKVTDTKTLHPESEKSEKLQKMYYGLYKKTLDCTITDEEKDEFGETIDGMLDVGDVIQVYDVLYRKVGKGDYVNSLSSDSENKDYVEALIDNTDKEDRSYSIYYFDEPCNINDAFRLYTNRGSKYDTLEDIICELYEDSNSNDVRRDIRKNIRIYSV